MTYFISPVSVAQVATIINAIITFVHLTISVSLVMLLIHFMPKTNTALAWSSISKNLHSSAWPTILRTDSSSGGSSGAIVSTISRLTTLTTILVAVAGVVLPLGLSEGPTVSTNPRQLQGQYVPDHSPLALSTSPNRNSFVYGRQCGFSELVPCPGNNDPNVHTISPSTIDIFNSTPHGPFTLQYRRFYQNGTDGSSIGYFGTGQVFMLRNDTSIAEGLIIDMSSDHPGIGIWDQTIPDVTKGATWSQDILWLEPVTECVNTNLTVDYFLNDAPDEPANEYNITDQGGFVNLVHELPPLNRDGQHIDLRQHAYKGAAISNVLAMRFLNATRESSFIGASYPLNASGINPGEVGNLPLSYLNLTGDANVSCQGFGGADTANITNVHVECGAFLGPPLRTDGGDSRLFDLGSRWRQDIHVCSSATRASIHTVTFSTNSTSDFQNIQVSRMPTASSVLWATEKTNLSIRDIDLFWGRVDDRYENDPSLWTIRADAFYLPAGFASMFSELSSALPASAHAPMWGQIYNGLFANDELTKSYSGDLDFGIKTKFQSLVNQSLTLGNAQIRNLIWTDMMINNVAGTPIHRPVFVANHLRTIQYDFRFAIPGLVLLLIWMLSFLGALFLLITRSLTFEHMRRVLNHTSVGRVVAGTSALRVSNRSDNHFMTMPNPTPYHSNSSNASFIELAANRGLPGHRRNKSDWANTTGKVKVVLELDGPGKDTYEELDDIKLMGPPNRF